MRPLSKLFSLFRRSKPSSPVSHVGTFDHSEPPPDLFLTRPTELVNQMSYVLAYAPDDYPVEDGGTNATNFAEMLKALDFFRQHTRSDEGREAVDQVIRSLHLVYEKFEDGDEIGACRLLQETEALFQQSRRFIAISDE